ncbi:Tfp pilus assembly PilM family ATPase [Aneurinibacillus soli]|uniref:Competence protein A n=1 Tax=Aneurinibacillus soli TaxID=1500254 RepID=A0A0U5BFP3_9BACL|nr:pilus assembly protein PilM [Aneurinibacillus soli]PYE62427.1 Tfp pilus assembly PilM family ATPase [Aneurinibacillus soli]BAU26990.1 Competence protein A [Aneurinibacillus soli]
MKLPFFRQPTGSVGMLLTDTGLRYAEVRTTGDRVQVKQAGLIELESGCVEGGRIVDMEKTIARLSAGLRHTRLKHKRVSVSVPTSMVIVRTVPLPKVPAREVRPLLEMELSSTVHLPFTNPYFDYYKLPDEVIEERENEEGQTETIRLDNYLIVAAPGGIIEEYTGLFDRLDLSLHAIDIEPLALHRLLMRAGVDNESCMMYMQFGTDVINVSFFQEGVPEFIRSIPLTLSNYQSVAGAHIPEGLEAFAIEATREVERVLNFYQFTIKNDGTRVRTIRITGTFAGAEKVIEVMRGVLSGIDISLFPADHIIHPFFEDRDIQDYTIPIGLSMKG